MLNKYFNTFLLSQVVFNLTLVKGFSSLDQTEYYPLMYGHFIPFMTDGVNSLSMYFDVKRYAIEQIIFILLTGALLEYSNLKLTKTFIVILYVIFFISSVFIYIILLPDGSFRTINEYFSIPTLRPYWLQ